MSIKCFKHPEAVWGSQVLLMMLMMMSSTGVVRGHVCSGDFKTAAYWYEAGWIKREIEPWKASKWTEDWTYGSVRLITFKSIRSAVSSLNVNIIINWRSLRHQSTDQFIISLDRCHISALLQMKTDQYLSWVVIFTPGRPPELTVCHPITRQHNIIKETKL